MKDGRRTTFKERKKIVYYCLRRGRNYILTSMIHDVSYGQIYSWVKKYERGGYEMLRDRRGRPSPESRMPPEQIERIKRRIRRIKRKKPKINAEFVQRMAVLGNLSNKKRSK